MSVLTPIKERLKDGAVHRLLQRRRDKAALSAWQQAGRPMPPPQVYKHSVIRRVAARNRLKLMVETGTFLGGTLIACLDDFEKLYSIELSSDLFAAARRRFALLPKVVLRCGESANELPRIVSELTKPALFWLDAHYSGEGTARASIDTPINEELLIISRHARVTHAILIDDARLFDGTNGYPTIPTLRDLAHELWPAHSFSVDVDIVIIEPNLF